MARESCIIDGKQFCKIGDKPLRPPIARAGGKSQIADKIINKIPKHQTYTEPFVGGGAVFLKKPLAKKNVINDKDKDVATVFKSFKQGSGFNRCDMTPSKEKFDRIKNKSNKTACDIAYLNKLSFGSGMNSFALGKIPGYKNEGFKRRFPKRKDLGIKYQKAHQKDYKNKLKNTSIVNQDFKKVMEKNDSKNTLHYLDPPYYGSDGVYKERGVTPKEVCEVVKKMKGKVILSYNDHPKVRKACKGLKFKKVDTKYTLSSNSNNKKAKEVLISNY